MAYLIVLEALMTIVMRGTAGGDTPQDPQQPANPAHAPTVVAPGPGTAVPVPALQQLSPGRLDFYLHLHC